MLHGWLILTDPYYTTFLTLNEAYEQYKDTHAISLLAPNHSHGNINTIYKTPGLF